MTLLHTTSVFEHYRDGIRTFNTNETLHQPPLSELMQTTMPFIFMNSESEFLLGNEAAAELVGAVSTRDLVMRSAKHFCNKEFSRQLNFNDKCVMDSEKTIIFHETGDRLDNETLSAIAIKIPWYVNDKIVGLLYTGVSLTPANIQYFPINIKSLLNTGLLESRHNVLDSNIQTLTKREHQIFLMILKGLTARQISELLNISRRTTEHHFDTVKEKLGCKTKYEVIIKYRYLVKRNPTQQ